MGRGYVLIDGNSIGFAAHQATKLVAGSKQTQAIFGVIKTVRSIAHRFEGWQPIVLWDGRSWRKDAYLPYKAHRDADPKVAAMRDHYKAQKPDIMKALGLLGVWQMLARNLEADDLAGIMVHRAVGQGREVVMISGDQDWLQLVRPGVTWVDPIRDHTVTEKNFKAFTEFETPRAFLEGKALQGDAGDLGPGSGVGGIGAKGAVDLLATYGSVERFYLNGTKDLAAGTKMLKKWADFCTNATGGREIFDRNMALMNLDPAVLPLPDRLIVQRGALDIEAFTDFCHEHAFKTIVMDLENFLRPFQSDMPAAREAA